MQALRPKCCSHTCCTATRSTPTTSWTTSTPGRSEPPPTAALSLRTSGLMARSAARRRAAGGAARVSDHSSCSVLLSFSQSGGADGWGFNCIVPQTGERVWRMTAARRTAYGFGNAMLLTGTPCILACSLSAGRARQSDRSGCGRRYEVRARLARRARRRERQHPHRRRRIDTVARRLRSVSRRRAWLEQLAGRSLRSGAPKHASGLSSEPP